MRLHEIQQTVDESINLTRYLPDVENAIKKGILNSMDSFVKVKITPNIQANINETGKFGAVKQRVKLVSGMKKQCSDNLQNIASGTMKMPNIIVNFGNIKNNGEWYIDDSTITLNTKYLNVIKSRIWAIWTTQLLKYNEGDTLDYLETADSIIDEFKKYIFTPAVNAVVNTLAGVFIHEMVHAKQDKAASTKGMNPDKAYRSYLTNKETFDKSIEDYKKAGFTKEQAYRLYRGSPQEIAAFANQEAAKFIKSKKLDQPDVEATPQRLSELQNQLTYLNNIFKDKNNPTEIKIMRRYTTLMYKAVMDYVDRKNELIQAKQNTR
jgi:HEPN domain-containing protein